MEEQKEEEEYFPEVALKQIGKKFKYVYQGKEKIVRILGLRWGGEIYSFKTEETYQGIQFLMDPIEGNKTFWSATFPVSNEDNKKG